ncbi:MAG: TIM barrel protein [bacterium]|nr:TIM barrel protein [bacterium]
MNRRTFLTSAAATAGGVSIMSSAAAAQWKVPKALRGAFKDVPLRFSLPPGWFKGSYEERLAAIAELGAPGWEDLNPKAPVAELKQLQDKYGLQLSCIGGAGEISEGFMVRTADHDRVEAKLQERLKIAKPLGIKALCGLTGNVVPGMSDEEMFKNSVTCLKRLAPIAEENNVVIVMEALNVLVNHAGYFLTRTDQTMRLLEEVGSPNVKMLFDVYHQQITEGNVIRNLTENIEQIGHIHIGDNPGRQEPGTGEINYRNVFKAIYEEGYAKKRYDGFVTFECGNSKDTERALGRIVDTLDWV